MFKKGNTIGFKKGQIPWNKNKKGLMPIPWNKGKKMVDGWGNGLKDKKMPEWWKEKLRGKRFSIQSEKHHAWKGNEVSYRNLHRWVISHLELAQKCEHCGKEKTTPKSIHWANKSHQYKRKLTDWISLCVPCHKKYDISYKRKQSKI